MSPEEFHQYGFTGQRRARECVAVFVHRREIPQALAHPDRIGAHGLGAYENEDAEEATAKCGKGRRNGTRPARVLGQGDDSEHCPTRPARDEAATIGRDLHLLYSLAPETKGSHDQKKGRDAEYCPRHGLKCRLLFSAFQTPEISNPSGLRIQAYSSDRRWIRTLHQVFRSPATDQLECSIFSGLSLCWIEWKEVKE